MRHLGAERSAFCRHRAVELHKFLQMIERQVPTYLDVRIWWITAPPTRRRRSSAGSPLGAAAEHLAGELDADLDEVQPGAAGREVVQCKRGSRSVRALNTDIRAWSQAWNRNPRP